MIYTGKIHKYGSNIDTDAIIPARYLNTIDEDVLASHCLEDLDENFISKMKKGDILVADENFGCGSSREHAAIAIKAAGVSCIIAKSFARIFYRNAINVGVPVFECVEAVDSIKDGNAVCVDTKTGIIKSEGAEFKFTPFPEYVNDIINSGGLMNMVKDQISEVRDQSLEKDIKS